MKVFGRAFIRRYGRQIMTVQSLALRRCHSPEKSDELQFTSCRNWWLQWADHRKAGFPV